MINYFAYGSNLHPVRLMDRVASAKLVAVHEISKHNLIFHKKSNDGSSKCNLLQTGSAADLAYGAIYEIDPEHKSTLDRFEGIGHGYKDDQFNVLHHGQSYICFKYSAQQSHIVNNLQPYHWYKKLVVLGARYLQFPDAYIHSIKSVASVEDPDKNRRQENEILIKKIIDYR